MLCFTCFYHTSSSTVPLGPDPSSLIVFLILFHLRAKVPGTTRQNGCLKTREKTIKSENQTIVHLACFQEFQELITMSLESKQRRDSEVQGERWQLSRTRIRKNVSPLTAFGSSNHKVILHGINHTRPMYAESMCTIWLFNIAMENPL